MVNSRGTSLDRLLQRHRQAGVLIDTNLLLLLCIGILDRNYIQRFERTGAYTPADFGTLLQILQYFRQIIVTPHILTEISNLASRIPWDRRYPFARIVSSLLNGRSGPLVIGERHRPARLISTEPEFALLGLTDTGIVHQAVHRRCLVLTDDALLAEYLERRGIECLTIDDLRAFPAAPAGNR